MASLDRVKVLVLGDSGVGKSSLVHLLCHNQVLGNPSWTVGCSVDIRVHDYKEGTPEEKTYYIELWDVGGSVGSASSVKSTRAVFYNSVNGTKLDQIHETKRHEVLIRTAFLAEDFNAEEINLDCTNPRSSAAGSSNAVKLSRFFDKVIEKRYFFREGNQIPGFSDRKRFGGGALKNFHCD